jgi:superfamily II RNA helicase
MEIKKHLSDEEIAIYADAINDGSIESVSADIQTHIRECTECAEEATLVAAFSKEFNATHKKRKRILFRSWQLPAAAVAAAGIAIFVIIKLFPGHQSAPSHSKANTELGIENAEKLTKDQFSEAEIPKERSLDIIAEKEENPEKIQNSKSLKKEELLAMYVPDDRLEKLFTGYQHALRSQTVKVSSEAIVLVPDTDSLKWSNPRNEELVVEFFNNNGEKISSETSRNNSIQIPVHKQGLYYWKLINQDFDLLFVGKIIVR